MDGMRAFKKLSYYDKKRKLNDIENDFVFSLSDESV